MLPYNRLIPVDRKLRIPVFTQICNGIIQMISEGLLVEGNILPSTRRLAKILEVNRNTVKLAYDDLYSQGWIKSEERKGYFVLENLDFLSKKTMLTFKKSDSTENFSWNAKYLDLFPSINLHKITLAIDEGIPDVRLAPVKELLRECRSIHKRFVAKNFLKYSNPKGSERLRNSISSYLSSTKGIKAESENILITKGSQIGIYIASQILIEKGDTVAVVNSFNLPADSAFKMAGAKLLSIPVDNFGMNVDFLEEKLAHAKIKAVFVIPNHQSPTSSTMSSERRTKLLSLAKQYRFAIIEYDPDFDFNFDELPYLPLISCEESSNVIYIGSISKTFAPAVKIGFITGPEHFIKAAAALQNLVEMQGDTLIEEAFASLFDSGEMEQHFRKSVRVYKERRDLFCEILKGNFSNYLDFNVPKSGLAVWSQFDSNVDLVKTAENALKNGLYLPDIELYKKQQFLDNTLPMGFASLDHAEMEKAFEIFKRSIA